jgi:hypothetical protein
MNLPAGSSVNLGSSNLAEPVLERARRWLARRLEDPAVHVEHPSVIAAANAALADQAELE